MEATAKLIIFSGRVQGVGFRYTVRQIASRYCVAGYVKNLPEGSVEMHIQGSSLEIDQIMTEIADHFGNYIRETNSQRAPVSPRYKDFKIAY